MSSSNDILIVLAAISLILYLFYRSLFYHKKLTNFQQQNRMNLIVRQAYILTVVLIITYAIDYIAKEYTYEYFIANFNNIELSIDRYTALIFITFTLILFFINYKINSYINKKDNRKVLITQEATFKNFEPIKREVKPIKYYANHFNKINFERSSKDYSIQNVHLNISDTDIFKFKELQESKVFKMNKFYKLLIDYVNSKSEDFDYKQITKEEIAAVKTILDIKILIFTRFKNLTDKGYFVSISQLFQIANPDESEFLSFVRDYQHKKFSSTSINHAILFVNLGLLND